MRLFLHLHTIIHTSEITLIYFIAFVQMKDVCHILALWLSGSAGVLQQQHEARQSSLALMGENSLSIIGPFVKGSKQPTFQKPKMHFCSFFMEEAHWLIRENLIYPKMISIFKNHVAKHEISFWTATEKTIFLPCEYKKCHFRNFFSSLKQ